MCREIFSDVINYLAAKGVPLSDAREKTIMTQALRFVLGDGYTPSILDVANPHVTMSLREQLVLAETLGFLSSAGTLGRCSRHGFTVRLGMLRRVISLQRSKLA